MKECSDNLLHSTAQHSNAQDARMSSFAGSRKGAVQHAAWPWTQVGSNASGHAGKARETHSTGLRPILAVMNQLSALGMFTLVVSSSTFAERRTMASKACRTPCSMVSSSGSYIREPPAVMSLTRNMGRGTGLYRSSPHLPYSSKPTTLLERYLPAWHHS